MPLDQMPLPTSRGSGAVHSIVTPITTTGTAEVIGLSYSIPANTAVLGTTYRLIAMGRVTASTTASTMRWALRLGTALPGTLVAQPAASAIGATTAGLGYQIYALITITAVGSGGTCRGSLLHSQDAVAAPNFNRAASSGAAIAFNTTIDNTVMLSYIWSASPTAMFVETGIVDLVRP